MDFQNMSEKEVNSRFNQLIASTEVTCGAPARWFAISNIEEKRRVLAEIYRPTVTYQRKAG